MCWRVRGRALKSGRPPFGKDLPRRAVTNKTNGNVQTASPRPLFDCPSGHRGAGERAAVRGTICKSDGRRHRWRYCLALLSQRGAPGAASDPGGDRRLADSCPGAGDNLCLLPGRRDHTPDGEPRLAQSGNRRRYAVPLPVAVHGAVLDRFHLDRARQCSGGGVQRLGLQRNGDFRWTRWARSCCSFYCLSGSAICRGR